jgi:phytoene synthase
MPGEIRLQWWHEALAGNRAGEARSHPVSSALFDTVVRSRLPVQPLLDAIEARRFDVYGEPVATLAELEQYARAVGSGILALGARLLDADAREIGDLAEHAGIALTLTGLLRALPIHASRGQLYLPADLLRRHGVKMEDILAGQATPELRSALSELRDHIRAHLRAYRQLAASMATDVAPVFLPLAVVPLYLSRMERRGYDPLKTTITVPQWRRQWVLWRAARRL